MRSAAYRKQLDMFWWEIILLIIIVWNKEFSALLRSLIQWKNSFKHNKQNNYNTSHLLSVLHQWTTSFAVPSFEMLYNQPHIKMLIQPTSLRLNFTFRHKIEMDLFDIKLSSEYQEFILWEIVRLFQMFTSCKYYTQ